MIDHSLQDSGIFNIIFSDTVSLNDILEFLSEFEKMNNLPQDILVLCDLRKAKSNVKPRDILTISKMTYKATASFKSVRTAIVASKPNLIAFAILFTREISRSKTIRKVFSMEKAAIEWLQKTHNL